MRGRPGTAVRSDGRPAPSGPDAVDAALTRLGTSRRELEVWDDQLRAWLAADLLQPLRALAGRVHQVCVM